ncbi:MAG: hypothetical protein ACT4OW_00565 [Nitrososphaerota archaeon]
MRYVTVLLLSLAILIYAQNEAAFGTHLMQVTGPDLSDRFTINIEPLDKSTILVSGHAPRTAMEPVIIKVSAPNGNIVSIDQLTVDSDFNYMTKIKTGKLWKTDGAYVITAYQAPPSSHTENNIGTGLLQNSVSTSIEVVNGMLTAFNLNYEIHGGFVSNIQVDPTLNSLIISIDTQIYNDDLEVATGEIKGGVLTINLPRIVIDAKQPNTDHDDKFIVKVDGVDTTYDESPSLTMRILEIPFPNGSEEITITGTYVNPESGLAIIPEFGLLAPFVLLTSIMAIVILSLKNKFSILYSRQ